MRILFSAHDILYIFIRFLNERVRLISGHLMLKKELNFYRLQSWRKIVRPRVKFFEPVPQLAFPPSGTSLNWHVPQLTLPPTGIFVFFVPLKI